MKVKEKNLKAAGRDYVGDWLCWNEKQLEQFKTAEEAEKFINYNAHFDGCAADMGAYDFDTADQCSEQKASWQADWIYEGMKERVKEYLTKRFKKGA